jgi:hypothetical protein
MTRPSDTSVRVLQPLVEALRTRGKVAVLAGAGVSNSAGITTGEDLVRLFAAQQGDDPGPSHPVEWYMGVHATRPNYFHILGDGEAAPIRALRDYYGRERQPTPSHRALARLVAAGNITLILTTNFDRLLERALAQSGVRCAVAASLGAMVAVTKSPAPPAGAACRLIKLHGDYLEMRTRDTSPGDTYRPEIDALLDRVFGDFDLLVCGWSAAWDAALGRALARGPADRRTFWMVRGRPSTQAQRLIDLRDACVIPVSSSDTGLSRVADVVLDHA